ncbi:MAG: [protein-PII] uridylyltransferase [Opitutaceae bacterium]|jgi:[protein-PII] uridylyltransferase
MPDTLEERARDRLAFAADGLIADRLAACRMFLKEEMELLRARHEAFASGLEIVRARAEIMDLVLKALFDYAAAAYEKELGKAPAQVALVALGGYGRGELSPWSDIDIMFLFPSRTRAGTMTPYTKILTQEILYILWDCGLKVGHSTRTVDQVFVEARKDMQTKTSLLEARLVAGSSVLYEAFDQVYRNFYTGDSPKTYIAERLEDQARRRAKFGDTVFNQEPDVKNGVGGLRDFQNVLWMTRVKLGTNTIDELQAQGHLKPQEAADFTRSYDFLLRVRNDLHFQSTRSADILTLDLQPRVAWNLGYRQGDPIQRVERFMQDYYRAAQAIFRIAKLVESRLSLSIGAGASGATASILDSFKASRFRRSQKIDGFVLRGGELAAESPDVFIKDPVRMIRVFRHCQQLGCTPGFHLTELIRDSLPLITNIAQSADAASSFKAILSELGAVHPTLARMHEMGVLGRFIPEFDALTCFVQHELYHRYTADVHTLAAIRELDLIFTDPDESRLRYREVLHELADPALAYLILLLHDIGKAEGIKGHSESGVRLSGPILDRLAVSAENRELVLFVIKNHLAMARFWQKRDVDDPGTIAVFAEFIGDAERLRHLYIHTYCDSRGTSAELWNSYKDMLHNKLFRYTMERLKLGSEIDASHEARKKMTQQELIAKNMPGISEDEITAHFSLLPDRYFIQTDTDEVALHIQMVNRLLKSITAADSVGSLRPVLDWRDDLNRSITVVNIVTWDRAGLFYKLAGAFSVAGLNILGAKVISRSDHIAIDTFYVIEPGRGVVQSTAIQETFAQSLEASLVSNKDLYPEIVAQAKRIAATRYLSTASQDPLQSSFPPTVDVYNELSMQRTIVEIQARDQLGLLYRLAKTISERGFDITFARIGTERGVAIDTFYIENESHDRVEGVERLHGLRDALVEVISPPAVAAAS